MQCRDYRHAWRPHQASILAENQGFERILLCSNCGTERVEQISRMGEVDRRYYRYPEGFLAPKGVTIDKNELRVAAVLKFIHG